MTVLFLLAPFSVGLGLLGLGAFWWSLKANQYEDPRGDAARILLDHLQDGPEEPGL